MKRRSFPLRGDHDLLTPDTQPVLGVRLCEQLRSHGVASLSGHLSDSSGSESATGSIRRRPAASPTRRLRFEDETEVEAESRYLERQRQRRRAGQRGTGVLVSKPDLSLYIHGMARAGLKEAGHVVDRQQRGQIVVGGAGQTDLSGTVLGGGVNLDLNGHLSNNKGWSLNRQRLNLRTEPIRETYIGSVTPGETRGRSGARRVSYMQVEQRVNQAELNGSQVTVPEATPTTDLPVNPYAPYVLATPTSTVDSTNFRCLSFLSPPPVISSPITNGTKARQDLNQNHPDATGEPHKDRRSRSELQERRSSVKGGDMTAESQAPPTAGSSEGQVSQPIEGELRSDNTSLPEHFCSRDEPSRLSLRRLFSTVRLSRTRTSSLDRLSSRTRPSVSEPAPSDSRKSCSLLKKSPSVQSLSESVQQGVPVRQLRKSPSVQSLWSEQKKKKDRSADYRPAADQFLPRCVSTDDVSRPHSVRSVGRILQVCSDGTFELELHRPLDRTFGFIISRGRGRSDSGVYVDTMLDSSVEKLFAGLLAVGDEILEVNGEKVACLSLDQVTQLLIQNPSATVRILHHRETSPR